MLARKLIGSILGLALMLLASICYNLGLIEDAKIAVLAILLGLIVILSSVVTKGKKVVSGEKRLTTGAREGQPRPVGRHTLRMVLGLTVGVIIAVPVLGLAFYYAGVDVPVLSPVFDPVVTVLMPVLDPVFNFLGLSPARGLSGTWVSPIRGEGLVFEPKYNPPHRFHYDVHMELNHKGNEVTGTMKVMMCKVDVLDPQAPPVPLTWTWSPEYPVTGVVSGSRIEFTVTIPDMTMTFTGTFTSDLMRGAVEAYQPSMELWYVGEFHLQRQWS